MPSKKNPALINKKVNSRFHNKKLEKCSYKLFLHNSPHKTSNEYPSFMIELSVSFVITWFSTVVLVVSLRGCTKCTEEVHKSMVRINLRGEDDGGVGDGGRDVERIAKCVSSHREDMLPGNSSLSP